MLKSDGVILKLTDPVDGLPLYIRASAITMLFRMTADATMPDGTPAPASTGMVVTGAPGKIQVVETPEEILALEPVK